MPAPPPIAESPLLWGTEEHVRELFAGTGIELEFEREQSRSSRPSTRSTRRSRSRHQSFGPLIMARRLLEPQGRWEALLADLRRMIEERGRSPRSTS